MFCHHFKCLLKKPRSRDQSYTVHTCRTHRSHPPTRTPHVGPIDHTHPRVHPHTHCTVCTGTPSHVNTLHPRVHRSWYLHLWAPNTVEPNVQRVHRSFPSLLPTTHTHHNHTSKSIPLPHTHPHKRTSAAFCSLQGGPVPCRRMSSTFRAPHHPQMPPTLC